MRTFTDRNGTEIKAGHELNVPLDVFSTGIVTLNENDELSLELRFESKNVPLNKLSKNIFNHLMIQNEKFN